MLQKSVIIQQIEGKSMKIDRMNSFDCTKIPKMKINSIKNSI